MATKEKRRANIQITKKFKDCRCTIAENVDMFLSAARLWVRRLYAFKQMFVTYNLIDGSLKLFVSGLQLCRATAED